MEAPKHKNGYEWSGEKIDLFEVSISGEQAKRVRFAAEKLFANQDYLREEEIAEGVLRRRVVGSIGNKIDYDNNYSRATYMNVMLTSWDSDGGSRLVFDYTHSGYSEDTLTEEKKRLVYVLHWFNDALVEASWREYDIRCIGELTVDALLGGGVEQRKVYSEGLIDDELVEDLLRRIEGLSAVARRT